MTVDIGEDRNMNYTLRHVQRVHENYIAKNNKWTYMSKKERLLAGEVVY